MKAKPILHNSFIRSNLLIFILTALLLAGLFVMFSRLAGESIYNYYTLYFEDAIKENPLIYSEQYDKISESDIGKNQFIIYDDKGKMVYETNKGLAKQFPYSDLELVTDYNSEEYITVAASPEKTVERYYIYKWAFVEREGIYEEVYLGGCVLDEDYTIIEGDLFPNRHQFTELQMALLRGTRIDGYDNYTPYKISYETTQGQPRTMLVLTYADGTTYNYTKSLNRAVLLYVVFAVLAVLVVTISLLYLRRRLKSFIDPLNEAITSFGRGQHSDVDRRRIAGEFLPIIDNFDKLLDELEQSNQEKEETYQESRRTIANISHDLRTPLTVIQGYSQAYLDGKVPDSKKRKYMEIIHEKAAMSADMIDMLFDYTKIDHPDKEPQKEDINITEAIRQYLAGKYEELENQGDHLEAHIPEEDMMLTCDWPMMTRLFDNLIGNAVIHNDKGITVSFVMASSEDLVRFVIADNGKGIPKDIRKVLFAPFVTENEARTSGKGTGLGMTIAKKIVDIHGGQIRLMRPEEIPGSGAAFEVVLRR